jgi:AhpD family alkylhydroperoxidase
LTNSDDDPVTRGASLIAEARFNWGFVPQQTEALAQAVDALDGYAALIQRFEMTSLTAIEQQVVYIATSRMNACGYCIAAHSQILLQNSLCHLNVIEQDVDG